MNVCTSSDKLTSPFKMDRSRSDSSRREKACWMLWGEGQAVGRAQANPLLRVGAQTHLKTRGNTVPTERMLNSIRNLRHRHQVSGVLPSKPRRVARRRLTSCRVSRSGKGKPSCMPSMTWRWCARSQERCMLCGARRRVSLDTTAKICNSFLP
jgi:hypothetical protein